MFFRKTKGIIIRTPLHNFPFPTPFMLTLLVQSDFLKASTHQISFPGILSSFLNVYCSPTTSLKLTVAVSLQSLQQPSLCARGAPGCFGGLAHPLEEGQVLGCAQQQGPGWVSWPSLHRPWKVSKDQNKHLCPKKWWGLTPLLSIPLAGYGQLCSLPSVLPAWPWGTLLAAATAWAPGLLRGLGLQVLPQSTALVNKQSIFACASGQTCPPASI